MRLHEALFIKMASPSLAGVYSKRSQRLFFGDTRPGIDNDGSKLRPIYHIEGIPSFLPMEGAVFSVADAISEDWGVVLRKKDAHPQPSYKTHLYRGPDWSEEEEVLAQLGDQIIYDANEAANVVFAKHFEMIETEPKEKTNESRIN